MRRAALPLLVVVLAAARVALPGEAGEALPREAPLAYLSARTLGPLRAVLADVLWVQAEATLERRDYLGLPARYGLLASLQPEVPDVWVYNGWNLAYNIPALYESPEDQWDWIRRGIGFLEEGLRANPQDPAICSELGLLYRRRLVMNPALRRLAAAREGRDPLDTAAAWYREAWLGASRLPDPVERYHQGSLWLEESAGCRALQADGAAARGAWTEARRLYLRAVKLLENRLLHFPPSEAPTDPERRRAEDVLTRTRAYRRAAAECEARGKEGAAPK